MPFFDPETTTSMSSLNMDEYRYIYNPTEQKSTLLDTASWKWIRRPRFQLGLVLFVLVVFSAFTPFGLHVTTIYDSLVDEFMTTIEDEFSKPPKIAPIPGLTDLERRQLQDVADQMLLLYHTLAEMRYIDLRGLQYGPHRVNIQAAFNRGIDARVIYLHRILPTVNPVKAGQLEFIFGGEFCGNSFRQLDMMALNSTNLAVSSETLPNNSQMVPLSVSATGQPVMLYDPRLDRMWIFDRSNDHSDLASTERSDTVKSLFNQGKPASEALDSMRHMLRRLEIIPGVQGNSLNPTPEYETLKYIYEATHWHGSFDGDSFEASRELMYSSVRDMAKA